jgi:CheY-like chemotaxis protein
VRVVENQQEANHLLAEMETLPDLVLIDADQPFNTLRLIEQVAAANVTVATVVLASPMVRPDAVSALLAGAADHMRKPVDMDELVARVGRHVQRQHSIKNSRARGGDSSGSTTIAAGAPGAAAASTATGPPSGAGGTGGQQGSGVGPPPASSYLSQRSATTSKAHMRLASVVEDDYEETLAHVQEEMDELRGENQRLTSELAAVRAQLLALQAGGAGSRGGSFSARSPSHPCQT